MAVRSMWETSTGELRVLMDVATGQALVTLLLDLHGIPKELAALRDAVGHTLDHPDTRERRD